MKGLSSCGADAVLVHNHTTQADSHQTVCATVLSDSRQSDTDPWFQLVSLKPTIDAVLVRMR